MITEGRISRRAFLVLGGVSLAGAAGVIKLITDADDGEPTAREALTGRVAASFPDRESARTVGQAYLESSAEEAGEAELVRLLKQSNERWAQASHPAEIRSLARTQSRRDYEAGHLVAAEGWYLSQTEARLCALTTFA